MLRLATALLLAGVPTITQQDEGSLIPGDSAEGIVDEADTVYAIGELSTPARSALGETWTLEVAGPGTFCVDLRSHHFDAYLVLRNPEGAVLAEDDDGLLATHARVVFEAPGPASYQVDACALHGDSGPYELSVAMGEPSPLSADALRVASLREARAQVRALESTGALDSPLLASALWSVARESVTDGRLSEARGEFARCFELHERRLGLEHSSTIGVVAEYMDVLVRVGEARRAMGLLERMAEQFQERLGPLHRKTAWALNNKGVLHHVLGEYEQAVRDFEQALPGYKEAFGRVHRETADVISNLAALELGVGRADDAVRRAQEALEVFEALGGSDSGALAAPLEVIGEACNLLGRYPEAVDAYSRAIELMPSRTVADTTRLQVKLAQVEHAMDDLGHARSRCEDALAALAGVSDRHAALIAVRAKRVLSSIVLELGDHPLAVRLAQECVDERRALLGDDHSIMAESIEHLGLVQIHAGRPDLSRPLLEDAIARYEAHNTLAGFAAARARATLTGALIDLGEAEAARTAIQEVLRFVDDSGPGNQSWSLTALFNLGRLERMEGKHAAAVDAYRRLLKVADETLGSDEPDLIVGGRHNLAVCLIDLGETEAALEVVLASRAQHAQRRLETISALNESEALLLAAEQYAYLALLMSLAVATDDSDARRAAYEILLEWKGLLLRSSRGLARESSNAGINRGDREGGGGEDRASSLRRLHAIQDQLTRLAFESPGGGALGERVRRLQAERERLERDLRASPSESPRTARLDAVRAALGPEGVLVDLVTHTHYVGAVSRSDGKGWFTEPRVTAWVVSAAEPAPVAVHLGPAAAIERAIQAALRADQNTGGTRGVAIAADQDAGTSVHDLLWEPLPRTVKEASTLFISPDGFTAALPWGIIRSPDGRFLIEDRVIIHVSEPSRLADQPDATGQSQGSRSLLVVGGVDHDAILEPDAPPDRSGDPGLTRGAPARSEVTRTASTGRGFGSRWPALSAAGVEARAILRLHESLPENGPRLLLQGLEATKQRLEQELPRFDVVHIATHGFFDAQGQAILKRPNETAALSREDDTILNDSLRRLTARHPGLLSGLVLAGANIPTQAGDAYLTADEVSWLDLTGTRIAVLSACETGLGRPEAAEGLIGLRRSFLAAGVDTVIASLWSVEDESTNRLMQEFYAHMWERGLSPVEALHAAQRAMLTRNRDERDDARPRTWGAFVLDGEWR